VSDKTFRKNGGFVTSIVKRCVGAALHPVREAASVVRRTAQHTGSLVLEKALPANVARKAQKSLEKRLVDLRALQDAEAKKAAALPICTHRREELAARLQELNGQYYKDPASLLHQEWQRGADKARFYELLEERNCIQQELSALGPLFKKDLQQEEAMLQARLQELNGRCYEDPASLLHQEWRKGGESEAFQKLLKERNAAVARLHSVQGFLREKATEEEAVNRVVSRSIDDIQKQLESAKAGAGIDWKKVGWFVEEASVLAVSCYL
jgi:hypothetical protein